MNWTQLKTVLWLRWRLSRNQFSRRGAFNVVVVVIATVLGAGVAIGAFIGGFFGGWLGLADAAPQVNMLVWDAIVCVFLFIWMIGVLTELQRSETIDLARLLHLPVTLEGIFVINYIASHLTFSLILFLPIMLGLCIGLVVGKGAIMLLLFPLVLTFVFMVTALTYCVRGWLITLMVNPRRRRNILAMVAVFVILVVQGPNLYFNVYLRNQGDRHRNHHGLQKAENGANPLPQSLVAAHTYVPFLWLPNGAKELAGGNVMPAVFGSLGAFLLGALGLARAFRSTMRFYTGYEKGKPLVIAKQMPASTAPLTIPKTFVEKQVPFVSEDVAALTLAFLRGLMRAPEIRIVLFTNIIAILILFGAAFSNIVKSNNEIFQLFAATGAVAFTFFGLVQMVFNQFGHDRDGFRILVLSPMRRRDVLLSKNLALAPIIGLLGVISLVVVSFLVRVPVLGVLAALLKLPAMFLLLCLAGNFVSMVAPFRVTAGSLKPTKPPPKIILLLIVLQMLFPLLLVPVVLPVVLGLVSQRSGFLPATLVDACGSLVVLAVAALLYRFTLDGFGDFLERREQKILLAVAQETE